MAAAGVEEGEGIAEASFQAGGVDRADMPVKGAFGQIFDGEGIAGRVSLEDQDPEIPVGGDFQEVDKRFLDRGPAELPLGDRFQDHLPVERLEEAERRRVHPVSPGGAGSSLVVVRSPGGPGPAGLSPLPSPEPADPGRLGALAGLHLGVLGDCLPGGGPARLPDLLRLRLL